MQTSSTFLLQSSLLSKHTPRCLCSSTTSTLSHWTEVEVTAALVLLRSTTSFGLRHIELKVVPRAPNDKVVLHSPVLAHPHLWCIQPLQSHQKTSEGGRTLCSSWSPWCRWRGREREQSLEASRCCWWLWDLLFCHLMFLPSSTLTITTFWRKYWPTRNPSVQSVLTSAFWPFWSVINYIIQKNKKDIKTFALCWPFESLTGIKLFLRLIHMPRSSRCDKDWLKKP